MENRKSRVTITVTVICAVFLIACLGIREINRRSGYNEAVQYIETGDYESALEIFERLGSYRDTRALKNYAKALCYAEESSASGEILARAYISQISESYRGEFYEEIRSFRHSFGSDVIGIHQ